MIVACTGCTEPLFVPWSYHYVPFAMSTPSSNETLSAAYSGSSQLSPAVGTAVLLALAVARIPTSLGLGPGG